MTDLEMLEFAAKAMGKKVVRPSEDGNGVLLYGDQDAWNTLASNGDALGLAVDMRMNVYHAAESAYAEIDGDDFHYESQVRYIDCGGDAEKATRKAITLCAASYGMDME